MITEETASRWAARPVQAALIRVFVFFLPIAGSVVFIHVASRVVVMPTSSFLLFVSWWVLMSGAATLVLVGIERAARRLLPLVALYKLSLVFPDAAPSRFRNAMRSNTADTLAERVARAKANDDSSTPVEAAERLLALVADLNVHDRLTRGHSDRVRAYAQMIGKELHLSADELDLLNWAALVHDVGKLNVPVEVLASEGRPTDEEWEILRRHPEFGQELAAPLGGWLGEWSRAVPQHHERWDGKGYPAGLSGEEIGLAARIVAVADVFDVITSARSYKSAFSSTAARDEIARCAGTQFDPRVVRAFLNISLGRLRMVMGPLSWLAHVPVLARLPLTPAIGAVAASVATVAAAVTTGLVATPPEPGLASTVRPQLHGKAQRIERVTREDETIVVSVDEATGGATVISLRLLGQPSVGRTRVTAGREILYSPPPDFSGSISLRYEACLAGRGCRRGVLVVRVLPVDDPPIARDDTATTSHGKPVTIDVLANDSDVEGDPLSILAVSGVDSGRARITGEQIRWSPPPKLVGKASFRYTVTDHHGGRADALVMVRVKGKAGPAPQQAEIPPPPEPATVDEPSDPAPAVVPATPADAPPQARVDELSVPEGATVVVDVLANDSDPSGDPLTLVSVGTPAHGSARKVGDRVQYTASADYVGRVTFPYTIADPQGGRDTSSVAVTVLLVNTPPSFAAGPDQAVLEDAGSQAILGWALSIGPGVAAESAQFVSFLVSNDNNGLFSVQPAIAPDGTLTYTPTANANGSATVTVRAQDDGGTADGGVDTSAPRTFTITVQAVNDPPSFAAGPDETTTEDAGPQSVAAWARSIGPGPANESGQTVGFAVSNDNSSLFTVGGQPRVAPEGTLSYTAAAGANGSAAVTVQVRDDGGTTGGGADTSAPQSFTITIQPVNDPPSFTAGPAQNVLEDAGSQSVGSWAGSIVAGPPDESGQSVSFLVSNDNNGLFSVQPAVASGGTLTYTPTANANGSATVTVRARDNGSGTPTSAPQSFTITVQSVNDPPSANADSATVAEDNATGVTFNVLANDTDVDTGDTRTVLSFNGSTIAGGTLVDNGGGSFTYVPDPGFYGTETFTYVVADGSGATGSGTVTITITPVPHAPVAGDDAYTTIQGTTLSVAAPGVLGNDGDQDGDPTTIQTTPVSGPTSGGVTLALDGSFVYTPNVGFVGTDSFTYRIDDSTARSATGVVVITVTAAPALSSTLYFQNSGLTADIWNMTMALPPAAPQLTDFDADGKPGLTIKASDGKKSITESNKFQIWTYTTPAPLLLNGPVTLDLWSSTGVFSRVHKGTLYAFLYDCTPGGASNPQWSGCSEIASNTIFDDPWNTSLLDWGYHAVTIGTVNGTIAAGNELRVRILFRDDSLWLTMTSAYPTALVVTLG